MSGECGQDGWPLDLDESDLADATQARPEDVAPLRTDAGDLADAQTGEVLEDAPGWDPVTKRILSMEGLDWAGARLREKHEAMEAIRRMEGNEVARINKQLLKLAERTERAEAPLRRDAEFLEAIIRAYAADHKAEILKGRRTKSALLPSGLRVGWKTKHKGGEYVWDEKMTPKEREAALVEWANAVNAAGGPCLVYDVPKPDLTGIKTHLAVLQVKSGHSPAAPPGLEWVPEHEDVVVKVTGEEKP